MSDEPSRPGHYEKPRERPTARRRHALRRLRALAGRYRKHFLAAGALAIVLAAGLTAVGVFESDEAVTLGTARAGIMADSAEVRSAFSRSAFSRSGAAQARPDSAHAADSLRPAKAQDAAEADNTSVVEEAVDEVAELVGQGEASYYGASLAGRPTASGEPFDPARLTAAHRTLPLGSKVRVTNLRNDESVVVRINDRGPYHGRRILDLSRRAARRLGMLARGKARVKVELLEDE